MTKYLGPKTDNENLATQEDLGGGGGLPAGLYTWGARGAAAGDGSPSTGANEPTFIPSANFIAPGQWISVSVGKAILTSQFVAAVRADGTLWTWGDATNGRLGNGTTTPTVLVPTQVGSDTDWSSVSAGANHCLAIKDGKLFAWGLNNLRQLGDGTTTQRTSPVQIGSNTDWTSVSAGENWSAGIRSGRLFTWGNNSIGRTGQGTDSGTTNTPTQIGSNTDWTSVSAGPGHGLAVRDGKLFSWGWANGGRLGNGTDTPNVLSPTQVGSLTDWSEVFAGSDHNAALRSSGLLYTWGSQFSGKLADGTSSTTTVLSPTQVNDRSGWTWVSPGTSGTMLGRDGLVYYVGNTGNREGLAAGLGAQTRPAFADQFSYVSFWMNAVGIRQ